MGGEVLYVRTAVREEAPRGAGHTPGTETDASVLSLGWRLESSLCRSPGCSEGQPFPI